MPHAEAVFRFITPHAEQIYRAIGPELSDEINTRSMTSACVEDTTTLVLRVDATDIAALRAALNMALRLVNIADEMQQIARE